MFSGVLVKLKVHILREIQMKDIDDLVLVRTQMIFFFSTLHNTHFVCVFPHVS